MVYADAVEIKEIVMMIPHVNANMTKEMFALTPDHLTN
jgi:hypothetical protein